MELLQLQPELLALLRDRKCRAVALHHRIQTQRWSVLSLRVRDIEGREVCGSQELAQKLPAPDVLSNCNITLILDNSKISEMSLSNGPVFMMLQKSEALN